MGGNVVGIDHGGFANDYIYGGVFDGDNHIVKRSIDPNEIIVKNTVAAITGVAVDDGTGYLYTTTASDEIEVYDPSGWTEASSSSVTPVFTYDGSSDEIYLTELAGLVVGPDYLLPFKAEISDDVTNCVKPRDENITYTIDFDYQWTLLGEPDLTEFTSITVTAQLADELDFVSASDNGSETNRVITWSIDPDTWDGVSDVSFIASPNKNVLPESSIVQLVTVTGTYNSTDYISTGYEETDVCDCTGCGDFIRVDNSVNAANPNGTTWALAFDDLQDALAIAKPCDEVWVAFGDEAYTPNTPADPNASFVLPNTVKMFGGFEGDETVRYMRNFAEHTTTLSGDITHQDNALYVVTNASNAKIGLIDGFTIEDGDLANVYIDKPDITVQHSKVTASNIGVHCYNAADTIIRNNWLYENGLAVYLEGSVEPVIIQNNTIADNTAGIHVASGIKPKVTNTILWGNTPNVN